MFPTTQATDDRARWWFNKALLDAIEAQTCADGAKLKGCVKELCSTPSDVTVTQQDEATTASGTTTPHLDEADDIEQAAVEEHLPVEEPAAKTEVVLYWRVHNTFLEFIGKERGLQEGTNKRCSSADSALAPSKDDGYVKCLRMDKVADAPEATKEHSSAAEVNSVMLRNIACKLSQEDIAAILDAAGFDDQYDWIYTPRSLKARRSSNLGYAFVHFKTAASALRCQELYHGRCFGHGGSKKLCEVVPAQNQGQVYGPKKARSRALSLRQADTRCRQGEMLHL